MQLYGSHNRTDSFCPQTMISVMVWSHREASDPHEPCTRFIWVIESSTWGFCRIRVAVLYRPKLWERMRQP